MFGACLALEIVKQIKRLAGAESIQIKAIELLAQPVDLLLGLVERCGE